MFNAIRAHFYYSRLQHEKGEHFIRDARALASIGTEEAIRYLLDIIVSRDDLNYDEKSALAKACASVGHAAARYLMNEIYDEHGRLQYSVVSALGRMRESEAVPIFIFLLEQTDDPIFAHALGEIGDPDASTILCNKVLDPESRCRLESLEALAGISAEDNIDILMLAMKSGEFHLQRRCAQILKGINHTFDSESDRLIYEALCENWDAVVIDTYEKGEALFCFTGCPDHEFMEHILTAVAAASFHGKIRLGTEFVRECDSSLIELFLEKIENTVDDEEFSSVFSFLRHDSAEVRSAAGMLLAKQGKSVMRECLERLAHDDSTDMLYRTSLALIAAKTGARNLSLLHELLSDTDRRLQSAALEILGEIGDRKSRVAVERMVSQIDDADLLQQALWTLAQIGDPETVPLIWKHAGHGNTDVRMTAYESLLLFDQEEVREELAAHLEGLESGNEKKRLAALLELYRS